MIPRPRTLTHNETPFPKSALVIERPRKRRLSESQWNTLSTNLWNIQQASYSSRIPLEENIKAWEAVYELEVAEKNFPWPGCSNIVVPLAPAKLDTLLAQIASQVFVPEFYIANGSDPQSAQEAYRIQRYYNVEFRKERLISTWIEEHLKVLHLGLLHGTAVMETMWKYRARRSSFAVNQPKYDEESGLPSFDNEGMPEMETSFVTTPVVDYNAVNLRAVRLRDIMLAPDESINIEEAAAVMRAEWFMERDMQAMVREGLLDADAVEFALAYLPQGISDVSSDRQGYYDKAAGWQLQLGQGQGMVFSEFFKNRGPAKVWRIHSDQFDMDGDGFAEENVFWLHEQSMKMLGWCPDNYIAPTRPFKAFSPAPRPDRFYGFSFMERLAPLQAEASTLRNQRNDAQDLATSPPLLRNKNEEIADKNMQWGAGKVWDVGDINNAVKQIAVSQPAPQAYQEEDRIDRYADALSGLSSPIDGTGTSGRRTATEIRLRSQSTNVRASLIAFYFRTFARSVIQYVHRLNRQHVQPDADGITSLTADQLRMNVEITVAGMNDPLNLEENIQEALGLYTSFMQDPDIQADPVARYNLRKNVLVSTHSHNIEAIIGTEEEAQKRKEQEQQMRAQQMSMPPSGKPSPPQPPGQPGAPQNGK